MKIYADTNKQEIQENDLLVWSFQEIDAEMDSDGSLIGKAFDRKQRVIAKKIEEELFFVEIDVVEWPLEYIEEEIKNYGKEAEIISHSYADIMESDQTYSLLKIK